MGIKTSQLDTLQLLVNKGIDQSVVVLNEIFDSRIGLRMSPMEILSVQQASQQLEQRVGLTQVSAMRLPFTGQLGGNVLLVFPLDSAAQLVTVLMHEATDLPDLNAIKRGMLSEIGNIILNRVMTEISRGLKQSLQYAIPSYFEGTIDELLSEPLSSEQPSPLELKADTTILLARTRLACDLLQFTGEIVLVFTVRAFDRLLLTLDS